MGNDFKEKILLYWQNYQAKLLCQSHHTKSLKKNSRGAIYAKCILLGFIMHCGINLKKDVFSVIEYGEGNQKISGGENKKIGII